MARRFTDKKLVIASHNPGKVREIGELMAPFGVEVVSAGALGLPEPEETGTTFEANAELKALASARAAKLPALADDSGLVVHALNGDPGIYSARWAGPDKDFAVAMRKVEEALAGKTDRRAYFVAALLRLRPDVPARRSARNLRRDGTGRQARHEPPGPGFQAARRRLLQVE
jgi:XTP/dITP diphosphohydrolase